MKKKLIILGLAIGLGLGIVGCGHHKNVKADIPKQFEVVSRERIDNNSNDCSLIIVKHKETDKKFVIFQGYRKGGICPLD